MTAPPPLWWFSSAIWASQRARLWNFRKVVSENVAAPSNAGFPSHVRVIVARSVRAFAIEGVTNVMDVGLVEVRSQPNVQEVHHVTSCGYTDIERDRLRANNWNGLPTRNGDESIPRCWFARRPLVGLSGICPDVRSSDTVTPVNVMDAGAGHAFPVLVVPRLFASHGGSCEHGHSDRR